MIATWMKVRKETSKSKTMTEQSTSNEDSFISESDSIVNIVNTNISLSVSNLSIEECDNKSTAEYNREFNSLFINKLKNEPQFLKDNYDIIIDNIEYMFNEDNYIVIQNLLHLKHNTKVINEIFHRMDSLLLVEYGKHIISSLIDLQSASIINVVLFFVLKHIKEYINNKVFRDIVSILYNTKFDFVVIEINRGMLVLKDTM